MGEWHKLEANTVYAIELDALNTTNCSNDMQLGINHIRQVNVTDCLREVCVGSYFCPQKASNRLYFVVNKLVSAKKRIINNERHFVAGPAIQIDPRVHIKRPIAEDKKPKPKKLNLLRGSQPSDIKQEASSVFARLSESPIKKRFTTTPTEHSYHSPTKYASNTGSGVKRTAATFNFNEYSYGYPNIYKKPEQCKVNSKKQTT